MKRTLLFIGIFCLPCFLPAQQWYPIPVPTTQQLVTIVFTDTIHGYIPASDGSILESSNAGINWHTVLTGTSNLLADICFPTPSIGYSVGTNGAIVKTTDAGNTWPLINSPTNQVLRGVFFLNPDTGFICGQLEEIYRTTDGGTTWVQQNSGSYWMRQFSFPTPQIGYCAGDNHLVFKTTNGGLTWNQVSGGGINLDGVKFLTVDTGYVCGLNGYVAKSFDGGLSWQVLNTGITDTLMGLWFFDSHSGYCVGTSGTIIETTDGGATWTQQVSGTNVTLMRLYFFNVNQGFISGSAGVLLENCFPAPGPITGPATVCQGDTGKVYTVNLITGATAYHWTVPSGVIITSGNNTNTITVTYSATSVSGSFTVYAYNSICRGTSSLPFPVTVNQSVPVSVSVSASQNPVCDGTNVTFTATPVNGGASPDYQWKVNGANVGANSPTYSYIPSNGDLVSCVLTSSVTCTTGNPASSIQYPVSVNPNLPVSVTIAPSQNPVCSGSSVTFTATPVNGGGSPGYQWQVNGFNVGTNNFTYSYIPTNGDLVSCILTSSATCTINNPASSTQYPVSVNPNPIVTFTACFDTITTINAQPIKLKGGIPLGGTYSGPGVNSLTGIFTPATAGVGTKTITYIYTNAANCSALAQAHIINYPLSIVNCGNPITDIRDNKIYPTIQIGSQCWLASNLNYGTIIASSQDQRDNCIWEKYCYSDNPANCTSFGGLYQWDELMQYDDTPGDQGFCPLAWHIPTEAEWNTLFANWTNNGFAGSPLKYSGYSGFNALLSGARHIDKSWDFQGFATFFWSSSSYGVYKAWAHGMNDIDPSVSVYPSGRVNAFSVRCLHD
jgi:uncharacterized protein (TIGR02145 family)